MDTKSLEYFRIVYEERNMHRAASKLFFSQQGLSRIVQNLEKELGCKLFERDRIGMHPTAAGDRLYRSASRILEEISYLRRDIEEMTTGKRVLHLAVGYGVLHLLYPALRRCAGDHAELDIRWAECIDDECERLLEEQAVELSLNPLREEGSNFDVCPLFSRKLMLLVYEGHPLYHRDEISVYALKGEKLITTGKGFRIFSTLQKACLDAGFYPRVEAEVNEINLCHRLVSMGEGIGLTVDFIADMVVQEGVRAIPFQEDCLIWRVGMMRKRNMVLSKGAQAFWDFLRQYRQ